MSDYASRRLKGEAVAPTCDLRGLYLQHVPTMYFIGHMQKVLDYYAVLASDVTIGSTPMIAQRLFKALALAQLDRTAEANDVVTEIRALDPRLQIILVEASCLCAAARRVFCNGLRAAGFDHILADAWESARLRLPKDLAIVQRSGLAPAFAYGPSGRFDDRQQAPRRVGRPPPVPSCPGTAESRGFRAALEAPRVGCREDP
jgi:hypothetical protein